MDRRELLDACDANLAAYCRELATRARDGAVSEREGVLLYSAGHPSPAIVNGALRLDPSVAPSLTLERAETFFRTRRSGFSLHVRDHGDADLDRAAREAGYELLIDLPQMVLDRPPELRPLPEGAEVRRVRDASGLKDFIAVVEEAFEDEAPFVGMVRTAFAEPRSLLAPDTAGFLVYFRGEPASAAMTFVNQGIAFIGWVATRESSRRRGLGDAATRAAVHAGFGLGARLASLQAAPMGFPVYRDMGFQEISRYRMYSPPP